MALTVEDGTGVYGADAYATLAWCDAYWTARVHRQSTYYETWFAASDMAREGAIREATLYLDSYYGDQYRGTRRSFDQGLDWPRTEALDDQGYPLPAIPEMLRRAVAELGPRAITAELLPDQKRLVRAVGAGSARVEFEPGSPAQKIYMMAHGLLRPILRRSAMPAWG